MTGGSYALHVYRGGVAHTVLVWNGVKDYERLPIPENLATVNMGGCEFGKNVTIAQIGRPMNGFEGRSALRTLDALLQSSDSVILWARNTKTYESIRDELRMNATPMSRH